MQTHWKNIAGCLKENGLDLLPIRKDLRSYNVDKLRHDVFAGLSVALIVFPQAMAYALLAGLPIEYGLYGATIATVTAAIFSGSYFLNLGPTNSTAVLVMSALATAGIPAENIPLYLPTLLILAGSFLVFGAFFNVANLIQYISRSVSFGYITAIIFILIINQIHNTLGFELKLQCDGSYTFLDTLIATLKNCSHAQMADVVVSLLTVGIYLFCKIRLPRTPHIAITILCMAVISYLFQACFHCSFHTLSALQKGTWHSTWQSLSLDNINIIADTALALSFVCLIDGTSILKTLSARSGQMARINQMVLSLGLANIFCGLFSGMPASASLVRSSTAYTNGAKTALTALFCGLFCILGIIALGPLFHYIPKACLSTLLIVLAIGLFDKRSLKIVITSTKSDACVFFLTFISAFIFPIHIAIYLGVFLSIALFLRKAAVPKFYEYTYDDKHKITEITTKHQRPRHLEISILHIEGNLFFASSDIFLDQMRIISERPHLKVLLLKMRNAMHVDATCILALEELLLHMTKQHRILILSEVNPLVFKILQRSGMIQKIGPSNIFLDIRDNMNQSTASALKHACDIVGHKKVNIRIFADQTTSISHLQNCTSSLNRSVSQPNRTVKDRTQMPL